MRWQKNSLILFAPKKCSQREVHSIYENRVVFMAVLLYNHQKRTAQWSKVMQPTEIQNDAQRFVERVKQYGSSRHSVLDKEMKSCLVRNPCTKLRSLSHFGRSKI